MPRDENRREVRGGGLVGWVASWWRALVAETVATALLMWLGIAAMLPYEKVQLVHPAMAFGGVVAGNCVAFGATSGAHMNPAVTLAAVLQGRLAWPAGVAYAAAQTLGALLGFGALWAGTPAQVMDSGVGCTQLATGVAPLAGVAVEAIMTAALVLACCALWDAHHDDEPDHAAPLKLGLLIAGLIFAGGPATGASLNPARSLAPALVHGVWKDQWVYWAGPLVGAAAAHLLYRYVLRQPRAASASASTRASREELPLAGKP